MYDWDDDKLSTRTAAYIRNAEPPTSAVAPVSGFVEPVPELVELEALETRPDADDLPTKMVVRQGETVTRVTSHCIPAWQRTLVYRTRRAGLPALPGARNDESQPGGRVGDSELGERPEDSMSATRLEPGGIVILARCSALRFWLHKQCPVLTIGGLGRVQVRWNVPIFVPIPAGAYTLSISALAPGRRELLCAGTFSLQPMLGLMYRLAPLGRGDLSTVDAHSLLVRRGGCPPRVEWLR